MESDWDEFDRRGIGVVCIAAQKMDSITGAKKFVEEHSYRFPILFDETREIAKAYGVYHFVGLDAYRIARPAAFILDPEGSIEWIAVSPNQVELPANRDIFEIIEAIEAAGKY